MKDMIIFVVLITALVMAANSFFQPNKPVIIEKPVYIEKPVIVEKIVERIIEKPVEKIVYVDRIVEKPCERPRPPVIYPYRRY